eukprot:gb/GFBE01068249.1/.p1 GENE.gb/GFBE01068249.1/~~gb/GFBE01068249.1/.p1  ORF type:complete len:475 (+),score=35.32 gb/GFBE01068249.1/:1-1425(+)
MEQRMERLHPAPAGQDHAQFRIWLSQVWVMHSNMLNRGESPGDSVPFYRWLTAVLRFCIAGCGALLFLYCLYNLSSMEGHAYDLNQQMSLMLGSIQRVKCSDEGSAPGHGLVYLNGCRASAGEPALTVPFSGFEDVLAEYSGRKVLWKRLRIWRLRKARGIMTDLSHRKAGYDDDLSWRREELTEIGDLKARFEVAQVTVGPYKLTADLVQQLPGHRLHLEDGALQNQGLPLLSTAGVFNSSSMRVVTYPYTKQRHHMTGYELRRPVSDEGSDEETMIAVGFEAAFEETLSMFATVEPGSLALGALNTTVISSGHYGVPFSAKPGAVPLTTLLHVDFQVNSRAVLVHAVRLLAGLASGFSVWAILWPSDAGHVCCKEFFRDPAGYSLGSLCLALFFGVVAMLAIPLTLTHRALFLAGVLGAARGLHYCCVHRFRAGQAHMSVSYLGAVSGEERHPGIMSMEGPEVAETIFHVTL